MSRPLFAANEPSFLICNIPCKLLEGVFSGEGLPLTTTTLVSYGGCKLAFHG